MADIQGREQQRRNALEFALKKATSANTYDERQKWALLAMEFGDIVDEYRGMYPELFPNEDNS